jgi:hypothetical protein
MKLLTYSNNIIDKAPNIAKKKLTRPGRNVIDTA